MNTAAIVAQAISDLAKTIGKLVSAGDDRAKVEEALMEQAEANKARLDEIVFGGG